MPSALTIPWVALGLLLQFQGPVSLCLTAFCDTLTPTPTLLALSSRPAGSARSFSTPEQPSPTDSREREPGNLVLHWGDPEACSTQFPRGLNPVSRVGTALQLTLYWLSSFLCLPPRASQDQPPDKLLAHKSFPQLLLCTKALYRHYFTHCHNSVK